MKAVMISIHPKWVEKILNGQKTVEIRKSKSKPKLQVPFKCYIYCTKDGGHYKHIYVNEKDARNKYGVADHWSKKQQIVEVNGIKDNPNDFLAYKCYLAEGKVIGEFTCDYIAEFTYKNGGFLINHDLALTLDSLAQSNLTDKEFREYAKDKSVYGWHISDLVVYDKPKKLSEFYKPCDWVCGECQYHIDGECKSGFEHHKPLRRPSQSWCYVDSIDLNQ